MSTKNYISQGGLNKLTSEHDKLLLEERPKICEVIAWAAGNGDRSENADYIYGKKRLREIDSRLRFLRPRIENAVVVNYLEFTGDQVRFGATVTIENDEEKTYTIVGKDEIDLNKNFISMYSPMGKALMGKEVGDTITVQSPGGISEWEIVELKYHEWD